MATTPEKQSKTGEYLREQITAAVQNALKLPVKNVSIRSDGTLTVQCAIEGDGAKNLFWQSVLEHAE